ncbi:MAG: FHA domain-containing protein [Chloroflexi bacterium]|nr:FHA domain-containing protein [Chloroflexota bacterium]
MNPEKKTRVLILGGGFGGVTTAQALRRSFPRAAEVEITLVSEHQLRYDHLVLALGNVINLSKLPGAAQHGKTIKTLGDAFAIRNHVLAMLEAADVETDPNLRREMLTFVVAGGGFSGVEMVGELNDMVREVIAHFPAIPREHARVILLHSNARILPEMSDSIAEYALTELRRRGVEVRLNVRLAGATPHEAVLEGGGNILTRTLIVAVGNAPPPVLDALNVKKERGKIVVNEFLQTPDYPNVWALGDNAIVPNRASPTNEPSPPTAQFALKEGKTLAQNIAATMRGQSLKPFAFSGLGLLCELGHGVGVGELIAGIKIRGVLGWLFWRGVYWARMPSVIRKIQVAADWFLDIFLPRDFAQINLARTQSIGRAHYESGAIIYRQGDTGEQFYIIAQGEVEVIRERAAGAPVVIARLGKNEYFGETALLTGRRRNATIKCATPVDVITLARDDFTVLANSWLGLAEHFKSGELKISESPRATQFHNSNRDAAEANGLPRLRRRESGAEVTIDRDMFTFGRSAENQVIVNDAQVSRERHALIQRRADQYWIEDLNSLNGTWVNRERITQATRLHDNDVIQIGKTEFEIVTPQPLEIATRAFFSPRAFLVRGSTGEEIILSSDVTTLGRQSSNHVVVADPRASRRHALIQREGELFWIEDLSGVNGTFVNRARIAERVQLKDDDVIQIGESEFTFRHVMPSKSEDGRISDIIRGLDAGAPPPKPGTITDVLKDLDQPVHRADAPKPGSITDILHGLDDDPPEKKKS